VAYTTPGSATAPDPDGPMPYSLPRCSLWEHKNQPTMITTIIVGAAKPRQSAQRGVALYNKGTKSPERKLGVS